MRLKFLFLSILIPLSCMLVGQRPGNRCRDSKLQLTTITVSATKLDDSNFSYHFVAGIYNSSDDTIYLPEHSIEYKAVSLFVPSDMQDLLLCKDMFQEKPYRGYYPMFLKCIPSDTTMLVFNVVLGSKHEQLFFYYSSKEGIGVHFRHLVADRQATLDMLESQGKREAYKTKKMAEIDAKIDFYMKKLYLTDFGALVKVSFE